MDNLEKALINFFDYLPHHVNKWNQSVQEGLPFLKAFKNQTNQYRFIKRKKWSDEMLLKKFPDLERKLLEKIIVGIEQEMLQFRNFQNILASLNRELFRKHDVVSKCVKNELVSQFSCKGTVVPPIWQLIEFAENSKNYYAAFYIFKNKITFLEKRREETSQIYKLQNRYYEVLSILNVQRFEVLLTGSARKSLTIPFYYSKSDKMSEVSDSLSVSKTVLNKLEIALCSLKYGDESTVAEVENTILNISKTDNEIKDILAITAFCRE